MAMATSRGGIAGPTASGQRRCSWVEVGQASLQGNGPRQVGLLLLLPMDGREGRKPKIKTDFGGRFNLGEVHRTTQEKSCVQGWLSALALLMTPSYPMQGAVDCK
ncbi:hypothetical protein ZWY2020_057128 [Hordeum vulgare]|nr:hypothetical protein ZWY2020_057128 [Hordeum vulgare]